MATKDKFVLDCPVFAELLTVLEIDQSTENVQGTGMDLLIKKDFDLKGFVITIILYNNILLSWFDFLHLLVSNPAGTLPAPPPL